MASNPLSAISYTNKDFNTIYVELLDIIKELSAKWDPTISNESDPGVLLLKVNAIIADKNNYNIDKNILELYPETVTQDYNARNIYKQLAYNMSWYKSATLSITFKWVGDSLNELDVVTIPRYTMLTNEDSSTVYTLLDAVELDSNHTIATANAVEGTFQTLTINGSNILQISNLDNRNRVYFPESTVSENGVFISNLNLENQWQQVSNLQVCSKGNTYYEFGVDSRSSLCYIEFPEDIDTLIGDGIQISYVVSQGSAGNVSAKTIDRFYSEVTVDIGGQSTVLSADTVSVQNPSASKDGADPETIEDAYRNYRKTAGTFNTLVTLRDYANALYNSGLVSNAIVSDRTTDIQTTYKILTEDAVNPIITQQAVTHNDIVSYYKDVPTAVREPGWYRYNTDTGVMTSRTITETDVTNKIPYYRKNVSNSDLMDAFDLKLYLLHTPNTITSNADYQSTFTLEKPDSLVQQRAISYLYDQQCVQHNFSSVLSELPCLFKNSYPICMRIVPQHFLTSIQIDQVKRNIVSSLWNVCNSRVLDFGEEPNYDVIYNTICEADERIKVVILDEFDYTTFATYWEDNDSGGEFKDIPISNSNSKLVKVVSSSADGTWEQYKKFSKDWTKSLLQKTYFIVDNESDPDNGAIYRYIDDRFEKYSTCRKSIQKEIIARSVLAGCTPLFNSISDFNIQLNQEHINEISAEQVTTSLVVSPYADDTDDWELTDIDSVKMQGHDVTMKVPVFKGTELPFTASYTLRDNENIRFFAPAFKSLANYSNYTKYQLILANSTGTAFNVQRWSENVPSDSRFYIDSTDYNDMVYKYISNGIVIPVVDLDTGDYRLYTCDGSRLIALSSDKEKVSENSSDTDLRPIKLVASDTRDDKLVLWKRTGASGKYTFENSGYSLCTYVHYTADIDTDGNIVNPEYKLTLCGVPENVLNSNSELNHFSEIPNGGTPIEEKKYYTEWSLNVLDDKGKEKIIKKSDNAFVMGNYNCCLSQVITLIDKWSASGWVRTDDLTVSFWSNVEQNVGLSNIVDNVHCIDLNKFQIVNNNGVVDATVTISGVNDDNCAMYSGTDKWLIIVYQKDQTITSLDGLRYDPNRNYIGVAAILHKAWKASEITLYTKDEQYVVDANSDYQLKNGDSIVFFWRSDSSVDDSPYQYIKYEGTNITDLDSEDYSPIICPTFAVNGTSKDNALINPDKLSSTGVIDLSSTLYRTVMGMYGDNDLSGSKAIATRGLKQTLLDTEKQKYYFITNNIEDDSGAKKYRMTFTAKESSVVNSIDSTATDKPRVLYSHILQADEYFVMIDKDFSSYVIYEAGTLIGIYRAPENKNELNYQLTVDYVPYSDIARDGSIAFSMQCASLEPGATLIAREQQIHNIIAGNTLSVERKSTSDMKDYIDFKSWEDSYITADFKVSYTDSSGNVIKLPNINIQSTSHGWVGRAYLNLQCDTSTPQKIAKPTSDKKSVQQILVKATPEASELTKYPDLSQASVEDVYIQSSQPIYRIGGDNIDVRYIDEFGDLNSVNLYLYSVNSSSALDVRPSDGKLIVNGTVSKDNSMTVNIPSTAFKLGLRYMLPLQVLTNSTNDIQITLSTSNNLCPTPTKDNRPCIEGGGYNSITKSNLVDGTFSYTQDLHIYLCTLPKGTYTFAANVGPTDETVAYLRSYNKDDMTYPDICDNHSSFTLTDTTDLYLHCNRTAMDGDTITFDDCTVQILLGEFDADNIPDFTPYRVSSTPLYSSINNDFNRQYIVVEPVAYGSIEFTVSQPNDEARTAQIVFDSILQIEDNELFDERYGISHQEILEKVKELDVNNVYKYNNVIDSNDEYYIEDPLVSKSFFNKNHIMNSYVIGKAELQLSQGEDSYVMIVNNR